MPRLATHRPSILLVHDDSELLHLLTVRFEGEGFEVLIAATGYAAVAHLQKRKEFDAIVAGWDVAGGLGAELYQWALTNRYHLRGQFVFLSMDPPEGFDQLVEGRCLVIPPNDIDEIISVGLAAVANSRALARTELSADELAWMEPSEPTLLLVDDEPFQLTWMRQMLENEGFRVTTVDGGDAAMEAMAERDYDVVLCDWLMAHVSGADVYQWVQATRPHMASRMVFMSGARTEDFDRVAPGRIFVPKGQDSPELVHHLRFVVHGEPA